MRKISISLTICLMTIGLSSLIYTASVNAIANQTPPNIIKTTGISDLNTATPSLSPATNKLATVGHSQPRKFNTVTRIPCLEGHTEGETTTSSSSPNMCKKHSDSQQSLSTQFGRKIGKRSGLLGEFDGLSMGYQLNNGLILSGAAGYPVLSGNDKFNSSRHMYGLNVHMGNSVRTWALDSYIIEQYKNGLVSDRAIGGAIHYSRPMHSLLMLIDYDLSNNSLAAITTSGVWKPQQVTTISANLDIRYIPMQKRQQYYLRQTMAATEGWAWVLPEDRIAHLTKTYSGGVTAMSLSLSHAFSDTVKINGSFTLLHASHNEQNDDHPEILSHSNEYIYRLKISGNNWMGIGNSSRLDLRHKVTNSSRSTSASIDAKYSINQFWNIRPKLKAALINDFAQNTVHSTTAPALKVEYQPGKDYGYLMEAGGVWEIDQDSHDENHHFAYYVSLNYQAKF